MTNLLLRIFVKDPNAEAPASRARVGVLSGVVGIVCNVLLFAMKLAVGLLCGSVSITADAMNNLSDATSSVVTLVGFRLAQRPADEDHPYGHARYEYLSGLAVAAMIVVIGFELAQTSVDKILHPEPVQFSWPVCVVLVGSIAVKLWLSLFNTKLGRLVQSQALLATAADSRNDTISTAAVLVAGVVGTLSGWKIDGVMGLGVALFILYSGAMLAKETISPLLGENASPELRGQIVDLVSACPEVLGYHDLMVHDYGPGQRFASIHVEMDARADPMTCHEIIDDMERECFSSHGVRLVIHYDPIVTDDPNLTRLKGVVSEILRELDSRLSLHDFRMVPGRQHINLIFDISLPGDLQGQQESIRQELDRRLNAREEGCFHTHITFDPAAFNEG